MFIESIILHNYRAYRGHNETSLSQIQRMYFLWLAIMVLVRRHSLHHLYGAYTVN